MIEVEKMVSDDMRSSTAYELANVALDISAIKLRPEDPFTWASGYRMPIYNDNRMLLGDVKHRRLVMTGFMELFEDAGLIVNMRSTVDVIAGTSTAGIPHATSLADFLDLPMIYIRDKPKDHGMRNQIEGIDAESDLGGRSAVVIEDLISTGGSSAGAVHAVRQANGRCDYLFSIFSYGFSEAAELFEGKRPFDKQGNLLSPPCAVASILTYPVLLSVAKERGCITAEQETLLAQWRADPFGWGAKHGFPKVERK
jgi:orotate phosphoribosyltransferase